MTSFPFGISITDHEGKIVRKNARYDALVAGNQMIHIGVKPYDICKGWFKSFNQPLQRKDWPAMQSIIAGKPVLSVEINVQRMDGSFGTILESAAPIMDAWDRVSGAIVITQDITQQIQQERRLFQALLAQMKKNLNGFYSLAAGMPQLIWTATAAGVIDYINDYIQEYQGFQRQEDRIWHWEEVIYPEDLPETNERLRQLIKTGTTFKMQYRLRMANGAYRWHYSQTVPIRDNHGQINQWLGITRDIHERKNIEQALLARPKRHF